MTKTEAPQVDCDPFRHDWQEEYYGYKCRVCGMFVPFGCEPWGPEEDFADKDEAYDE